MVCRRQNCSCHSRVHLRTCILFLYFYLFISPSPLPPPPPPPPPINSQAASVKFMCCALTYYNDCDRRSGCNCRTLSLPHLHRSCSEARGAPRRRLASVHSRILRYQQGPARSTLLRPCVLPYGYYSRLAKGFDMVACWLHVARRVGWRHVLP